jgi:hypothetical protein
VISGDPAKPGPFLMRVKLPPGYTLSPYRWRNQEHIVVLDGTLQVGVGSVFDEKAMHALPSGSFISLAANEPHFAMTRRGAVLQIFGMGPFEIERSSFHTPGAKGGDYGVGALQRDFSTRRNTTIVTQAAGPACIPPRPGQGSPCPQARDLFSLHLDAFFGLRTDSRPRFQGGSRVQ